MDFFLDRRSDMPIRRQIRGMIEYAISAGELAVGEALPSVRELADQLGVAPMTVSQVYAALKRDGLVEARTGAGTFVADSEQARLAARGDIDEIHGLIDTLIDSAARRGVGLSELGMLVNARLGYRAAAGGRRSVVVAGLFDAATRSYAEAIAERLGAAASVRAVTFDTLKADAALRAEVGAADLIVTFLALRAPLSEMFPGGKLLVIRFIPSEATRLALAALDPMARVAMVAFPSFLPVMRRGLQRFAAHCQDVVAAGKDDPGLKTLLADRTVLVFASGAESATAQAPEGIRLIEYRHSPDPGDIDRLVKPLVGIPVGATQEKDAQ